MPNKESCVPLPPACRYGRVQKFWLDVKPCYDVGSGRVPMLFPTNREISDGTPSVCHTTVIRAGLCESCSSSKIGKIAALEGSKWMALILFLAKCHHKRQPSSRRNKKNPIYYYERNFQLNRPLLGLVGGDRPREPALQKNLSSYFARNDEYLDSAARENRLDPMSIVSSYVSLDSIEIYTCFMFRFGNFYYTSQRSFIARSIQ